ncbi:MAG: PAS domain S-box protein, partial [Candidatus Cloacimonadota bacterium]|nr:PAS domain S-box protein [Candidatus Cloacimonadota bacterium]
AIFNNAIAGIIISDFNFNINYANNYFKNIVLKDGNSYSNEKIIEFVHPDDKQQFIDEIKKLKDNKSNDFYAQIRFKNSDDDYIWTGLSCSKISARDKEYMIMVLIDINDQKKSQVKILELEKRNSAMAMAVTANHELNQPLMVISGNLDMIVLTSDDSFIDKHSKRIEKINESIDIKDIEFDDYTESTEMVKIEDDKS